MAFTQVTVTHNYDLPSQAGALGTVEFTPSEAMHNAGKTVYGPRRGVLDGNGALSVQLEATTDPGTWPTGVRYRVTERITGLPARVYYVSVPHDLGAALDLDTLIASAGATSATTSGSGFAYAPVTLTAASGVITPHAALGYGPHLHVATTDVTLAEPTGGSNGQPIEVWVLASGGDRVLTVAGSAIPIPSGTYWWGHYIYDAPRTAWILDDSGGGGGGVSYTDEQVRDVIGAALVAGANITITPDDTADTITIAAATTGASGIPASTVDAKGDLIAGTANDTVARHAVGSDGLALVAASAAATGLAWQAPVPATHGHAAADLTSGLVPTGRLGSGTPTSSTFLRGDQTWAAPPAGGGSTAVHAVGNSGTALTLDASSASGYIKTITLTANCTFTLVGTVAGQATTLELVLTQDATGSRTVTWPAAVKWSGGAPILSTAAGATDRVVLTSYNNGTTWYADLVGKSYT